VSYGFDRKVVIIENAVDPDMLKEYASQHLRRDHSTFNAVWVGQAAHRKGLDVALAALALARRRLPDLRLLVAGVPPGRDVEGVEWLGVVPPEDISKAYRRADVLLFPTRYEAHPLVVLEAMAAGLPVIVSDAVPPGMVVDGRNGLVIMGHEPEDYAAALVELHNDAAQRARMETANQRDVRRFDQATAAGKYAQVVLALVGGSR
jgi:glycosyltransferase involved in cell wall biosynthesis